MGKVRSKGIWGARKEGRGGEGGEAHFRDSSIGLALNSTRLTPKGQPGRDLGKRDERGGASIRFSARMDKWDRWADGFRDRWRWDGTGADGAKPKPL